jgi:hypothetical protein
VCVGLLNVCFDSSRTPNMLYLYLYICNCVSRVHGGVPVYFWAALVFTHRFIGLFTYMYRYGGIIRHGAKLLYAFAEASVPKVCASPRVSLR